MSFLFSGFGVNSKMDLESSAFLADLDPLNVLMSWY